VGPSVEDLSRSRRRVHIRFMGMDANLLSPVQEGSVWRVQIVWANGAIHCFGKFASEKEAVRWIAAHPQLTKSVTEVISGRRRKRRARIV
jgi:hypothetical protein